jgi:hypothetical protein
MRVKRLRWQTILSAIRKANFANSRHCEEPTGPAIGRPDDKLRDEAIQFVARFWIASLRSQ